MNISERANRAAVDWLLRLESAPPGSAPFQAFDVWLAAHPEHARAWQRVNGLLRHPLAALQDADRRSPGQLKAASETLRAMPSMSRRKALGGGLAMLFGLGTAGVVNRLTPVSEWLADQRTATGERRTLTLSDGSRLSLDARTAVDIRFDRQQRLLVLREGAVQLDVVADPTRPFIVANRDGRINAQGSRFMVRQDTQGSLASVQQQSVLLSNPSGQQQRIEAGQAFAFDPTGINAQTPSWRSRTDWLEGRIDVRNEPLGQLVEALRPYVKGFLRISPEAARIRVYGVFPLDDSTRTLRSIAETLPVQINRQGFWLTRIETRPQKT